MSSNLILYERVKQNEQIGEFLESVEDKSLLNPNFLPEGEEYLIIHWTCLHQNLETLKLLTKYFVFSGNEKSALLKRTPLHCLFTGDSRAEAAPEMIRHLFESCPQISHNEREDPTGWKPFTLAAVKEHMYGVKYLLAHNKEFYSYKDFGMAGCWTKDWILILEKRYLQYPRETRVSLRRELGFRGEDKEAAEVMARLPLLHYGYFQIKPRINELYYHPTEKAKRFFAIALRLPQELQMILCNYSRNIPKTSIKSDLLKCELICLLCQ